jgi:hypothetical protein
LIHHNLSFPQFSSHHTFLIGTFLQPLIGKINAYWHSLCTFCEILNWTI